MQATTADRLDQPSGSTIRNEHRFAPAPSKAPQAEEPSRAIVTLIHPDPHMAESLIQTIRIRGFDVQYYASPDSFIASKALRGRGCLLLDTNFPQLGTPGLQATFFSAAKRMPIILLIRRPGLPSSARRLKALAVDFLVEPLEEASLQESVALACEEDCRQVDEERELASVQSRYASLTSREKQVLALVLEGLMNKQAAARLDLSVITVKVHRATMMRKMHCRRLVELVRAAGVLKF